ncbi:MAG: c-type cytochrome biogenesis protein CcmI [Pseudomonadota bacterium]
MTMGFWIAAALLMLTAMMLVIWPFLRRRPGPQVEARGLNLTIYRQRMAELDQELASGLMNREQYEAARLELEDNLITDEEDAPQAPVVPSTGSGQRQGGMVLLVSAILIPILALLIHFQLAPAGPDPRQTIAMGQAPSNNPEMGQDAAQHDPEEVERMIDQLKARLEQEPDDAEGWVVLARTYRFLERFDDAAQAYERAHGIIGDDPMLNVDYAETLVVAQDGRVSSQAARLLNTALEQQPDNQNALWLAAIGAFQAGELTRSREHLEHLQTLLDPDTGSARAVQDALREVGAAMQQEQTDSAPAGTDPQGDATVLEVNIELDNALAERLTGDEQVMVFARPVDGPRMPLAVVRTDARFPLQVSLEDGSGMGMATQTSMTQYQWIEVVARVSRSGMAEARSGDLEGISDPVDPSDPEGRVNLRIDRVLP